MKVSNHIALSVPIAGVIYALSRSWQMAVASLVGGVLVDVDHLLDYFIEYGTDFSISNLFTSFPEGRYRRIFIPFHAWELVVVLAVLVWLTDWNVWIAGLMIGFCHHMVSDQFANNASEFGYSLIWRFATRFEPSRSFSRNPKYEWNRQKGKVAE